MMHPFMRLVVWHWLLPIMVVAIMGSAAWAAGERPAPPSGPRGKPIRPRITNAPPVNVSTSMVVTLPGGVIITNVPPELLPQNTNAVRLPTRAARKFEPLGYQATSFTVLARYLIKPPDPAAAAGLSPEARWEAVRQQIPEDVLAMNGKKIALAGFILPIVLSEGRAREFLLLRTQSACCFGMVPRVNELVMVKAPPAGVVPALDVPFVVAGRLTVKWIGEGGQLTALYEMQAEKVERALDR